jgi:hypothetical protein
MDDNPIITRAERTGYAEEPKYPVCPVCGREFDTIFISRNGEVCGCNICADQLGAWEYADRLSKKSKEGT